MHSYGRPAQGIHASLLVVSVTTLTIVAAAYATNVSAQLDTSIEYAEYRNDRWHYSLAVPADMKVSEHEREGSRPQRAIHGRDR
jgi:hypothetical protein